MPIRSTAIRLFVSSTFSDFGLERQILDAKIFPELQRYCFDRGFEFQPVDLRWGISDDTATSQRTLRVCLNEVNECVKTTLRPYFLILLGDRYGWRPLPEFIAQDEFAQLTQRMLSAQIGSTSMRATEKLLHRWYRLDLNHVPPRFVLQPRSSKTKKDRARWKQLEQRIRAALEATALECELPSESMDKYRLSATAQEIHRGVVLASTQARVDFNKHVLCFHRKRLGTPPSEPLLANPVYVDITDDGALDQDAAAQLQDLGTTLKSMLGDNMLEYRVFPGHEDSLSLYAATFEADARRLLMSLIRAELPIQEAYRRSQQEWQSHAEFGMERQQNMLGRDDLIKEVDAFLDARGGRGLILHGKGGMGKSTLLAKAAKMAGESDSARGDRRMMTLQRYVGTTAESSTGRGLIVSLLRELGSATGASWTEHTDLSALGRELRSMLADAAAGSERGLLLAIDGLDQLPKDDPAAQSLEWLPWPTPPGLALILAVLDGGLHEALKKRMVGATSLEVGSLAREPGREVLRSLLREGDRRLQASQEDFVLERFHVEGSPLFLRIAAQIAGQWPAYEGAPARTAAIPTSTLALVRQFLATLHVDAGHEKLLVAKVFGLLMASERGLNEGELLALLWKDEAIQAMVRGKRDHSSALTSLPMIYWSRLRDDLKYFLVQRAGDGTLLLGFFHRLFDDAAKAAFLSTAQAATSAQRAIAAHFANEPTFLIGQVANEPLVNLRKISELPVQLFRLKDVDGLFALLKSVSYFRAKLIAGMSDELYLEFQQCASLMDVDTSAATRARLADTLVAHVIAALEANEKSIAFSTLDLHNGLVYRDTGSFYAEFLKRCIAALGAHSAAKKPRFRNTAIELAARLGNTWRRKGEFDTAERELTGLVPLLHRLKLSSLASTAEYELGYVDFMRGDLAKAAELFDRSAQTAHDAGHVVSEWMSRCVSANVKWIDAVARHEHADEAPRYLSLLSNAEHVFRSNLTTDGNALRWVYNVRHHRLKVAFRMDDLATAATLVEQIRADPWSRQYDQIDTDSIVVSSRFAILEGRMLEGARQLYKFANGLLETTEARAEHYFDAGMAFWYSGKRSLAFSAWKRGADLPASHGNVPWQRLIAEAQANPPRAT